MRPGDGRQPPPGVPAGPAWAGHADGAGALPAQQPLTRPEDGPATARRDDARILSWRRVLLCFAVGVVTGAVVAVAGAPELSVLVGWSVAAASVLVWVWRVSWPMDHWGTKRLAEEEGGTRTTDTVVLVGAVTSLAAVVEALIRSSSQDAVAVLSVVLGVLVVVLSWALVNTVFALKYARLYYEGGDGGIDFHQERLPTYSDFAYLAFTIGMSFAVSDTEVIDPDVRKVVLGHALLSFLFGTCVIAVAVNLVTNLGQ